MDRLERSEEPGDVSRASTGDTGAPRPAGRLGRGAVRRVVAVFAFTLVMGAILFLSAGTLAWRRAWVWLAANGLIVIANGVVLLLTNPEIVEERGRRHEGTKGFDRLVSAAIVPGYLGLPLVAGLDAVRFGWTSLPAWAMGVGLGLLVISDGISLWAMAVNRHLETTVRIQADRGHQVVTAGPYRLVRHPMYLGMCLQFPSWPLILGSAWAFVPAGAIVALFALRTALEDRTLRAELPGYEGYARTTRYRLVPGVW
jgi:protein-S-isoprenylcysteine O-methyltransferase Ste14